MTRTNPSERAGREAADWCARLNNRSVSTAELEAFYLWRRDPDNAAAYAETEQVWRTARTIGADKDIGDAVAEVLRRPVEGGAWRRWPAQLALAAAALLAIAAGIWTLTRPQAFETGVGEQSLVRLADGTLVRLDSHSRIEVRLHAAERDVALIAGQAFFDVAKDAKRPFIVNADGSTVRALGTHFGVRADGARVGVVLAEGSVRVSGRIAGNAVLRPGEAVALVEGRVGTPAAADIEALTSWTTGRLIFRDTPLVRAVAEMNRYTLTPIVIDTPRAAGIAVNGVFDTGNTDSFVTATQAIAGLHAERRPDGSVRLLD